LGVFLVSRHLSCATVSGGGTVFYVTDGQHRYLENAEEREEGGTPAIVAAIRCGLVFRVQQMVGPRHVERIEQDMLAQALASLTSHRNIEVLGNPYQPRVPVCLFFFFL
jgi:selenocysteine lyase/cysteine desulfurase